MHRAIAKFLGHRFHRAVGDADVVVLLDVEAVIDRVAYREGDFAAHAALDLVLDELEVLLQARGFKIHHAKGAIALDDGLGLDNLDMGSFDHRGGLFGREDDVAVIGEDDDVFRVAGFDRADEVFGGGVHGLATGDDLAHAHLLEEVGDLGAGSHGDDA